MTRILVSASVGNIIRAAALVACTACAAGSPGGQAASAPAGDPPEARQREICFPPASFPAVRVFARGGVVLWTDAPVDAPGLLAHLEEVQDFLAALLPGRQAEPAATAPAGPERRRPVALAVYRNEADYRALWQRVGQWYGGRFGEIETQGYSFGVFCATFHAQGELFAARRPVLCHEFAHVWLYQNRGLRNDGNWLTEGLATAVQLKFFPASGDRAEFAGWEKQGQMLPLKRLMDQPRIQPKDYWQAGTLVEALALRHRDKLPALLEAFNRGESAQAIVTGVLKADFRALERDWTEHVRAGAQTQPGQ